MIVLGLGELADIVGGDLSNGDLSNGDLSNGDLSAGQDATDATVTAGVEFDSRRIEPGGLFLAFVGDRVDGHDFVGAARARGAVAALVTRPTDPAHGPTIRVPDLLAALGALATEVLARLPQLTVIGVTGSSGKTSTKDLLAQLLAERGPTVAPPGSFNNELGLPYTVLRADPATRYLVLENSARGIGHIRYLTGIAPPQIAVVLNVGSAHLGEFGSRAAIAQAKGELVEALEPDGLAVLNADDDLVAAMATRTRAAVTTVGLAAHADVRAEDVTLDVLGRAAFTLRTAAGAAPVRLQLSGAHHVGNALAAAAVAMACGMAVADAAAALGRATARSRWRMEVTERPDGVTIVNDAYNANPESVRSALDALAAIGARPGGGRTIAVLGPMAELGGDAAAEHRRIGERLAELRIAHLVTVGEGAREIARGAAVAGSDVVRCSEVSDIAGALGVLDGQLAPGDVVLVKASRSAGLERLALALTASSDDGSRGPA